MSVLKTLGAAALTITLFQGCNLFDDAKEKIEAELEKTNAISETSECESYKEKGQQAGGELWQELYEKECQYNFISQNTPTGMDGNSEKKYETLVLESDSIIDAMYDTCTEGGDAKPECVQAKESIDGKAKTFQEECDIDAFYYPTIEEAGPHNTIIDGQCYWNAWIPPETRQSGQSENIDVKCTEQPPECTQEFINEKNVFVEKHEASDGSTVLLPCPQQYTYTENPCDHNGDGVVGPLELRKCEEEGKVEAPCDFNGDGMIDPFEKDQCHFANDDGFVDPSNYDPCDFNFDGKVDQWEGQQCATTYNCTSEEQLFWDITLQKDVCIPSSKVPADCHPPKWLDAVNGEVKCMDPCDMNHDGKVSESEKSSCNFIDCGMNSQPMWDHEKQEDVCIKFSDMPQCENNQMVEIIAGKATCIDPCDKNLDGVIGPWEKENCHQARCEEGMMPMWDPETQTNHCVEDVHCDPHTHPEKDPATGDIFCVENEFSI